MKTTYTVPEVPGSKRQSARPYTHAVIGYWDAERYVANQRADHEANRRKYTRWSVEEWNGWKRAASVKEGEMYVNHNGYRVPAAQHTIDIATEFLAKHPTLEGYLAFKELEFEKDMTNSLAKGNGKLEVLRWSMSYQNAAKGMSEFERNRSGLRVVECTPVKRA